MIDFCNEKEVYTADITSYLEIDKFGLNDYYSFEEPSPPINREYQLQSSSEPISSTSEP